MQLAAAAAESTRALPSDAAEAHRINAWLGEWSRDEMAAMLKLIDALSSQPPDRIVWASASETDLMLLLSDDVRGRAFANVRAQGPWYFIECAMAKNSAPWPEAWVKGHTCDLQKACGMIVSGWRWSQE